MTAQHDFDRQLTDFLREGPDELPYQSFDAVRDLTEQTGQRVVLGPWRLPEMNKILTLGLGAAAVVVLLFVGAQLFGSPSRGPGGLASVPPSVEPSTSTAAEGRMSLLDSPGTGDLPPGEYVLDTPALPARLEFRVPEGWWYFWPSNRSTTDVHAILVNSLDLGATKGSAWGLSFTVPDEVSVDPCEPGAGVMDASVTEFADSLAAAFETWTEFAPTVEDVMMSGYSGKRVSLTTPDAHECPATIFTTPTGYEFQLQPSSEADEPNQLIVLDVDGSVLVIWTTDYPATSLFEVDGGADPDPEAHVEDQVVLHEILDSIVIEPRSPEASD